MNFELPYSNLKSIIDSKSLKWQYTDFNTHYMVFACDRELIYYTLLYKPNCEPNGWDHVNDTIDFENNYKATANAPMYKEAQCVGIKKVDIGPRSWAFSSNFCDRTTWFGDAVRVVGETLGTGDNSTTVFATSHSNLIDVVSGKISDEDYLVPTESQGGSDYKVHVKLNGVEKTERAFGANSGGDYTVNYSTGQITFFVAPANGVVITADYFYENGSTMYIRPHIGKKTVITLAEAQFSADIDMTCAMIASTYTYNPLLGSPPAKFEYPTSRSTFKRFRDFVNYTLGSFPAIPAIGGTIRGNSQPVYQLRFDYTSPIILPYSVGAEVRVWLETNTPFNGEMAFITFYGYEESE